MPNIIKNPRIWIPPTLASAITGPLATCLFKLEMNGAPVSSGMGTCGFVGQIGVITGWADKTVTAMDWIGLVLIVTRMVGVSVIAIRRDRKQRMEAAAAEVPAESDVRKE